MFVLVTFVLNNALELTDVIARMDAVVRPVVNCAVPILKFVPTKFVLVIFVPTMFVLVTFVLNNAPELTDVVARMDAVVRPVVNCAVPLLKFVPTMFVLTIFVPRIFVLVIFVPTIFVPTIFVLVIFVEYND